LTRTRQERIKIYFAGPFFSEAERDWIRATGVGESEGTVVNAIIECSCDLIVRSREELMEVIKTHSGIQTVGSADV